MNFAPKEASKRPAAAPGQTEQDILKNLQIGGCPICNHVSDVVFGFIATWQNQLTNDDSVQQDHATEFGFCSAHTWLLAAMASPRCLSRGYPKLLELIAEKLSNLIDTSHNFSVDIKRVVKEPENCRVCKLLEDAEKEYTHRVADFLERGEAGTAGLARNVCLRHLSLLASFLNRPEAIRFLLLEKAKDLRNTAENMKHFVVKYDARERKLINHDEQFAYLRALRQLAGARNVFAPHVRPIR